MKRDRPLKPLLLVCLGLVGVCLCTLAGIYRLPPILEHDFVRGLALGVCLGAEIVGLILIVKQKRRSKIEG